MQRGEEEKLRPEITVPIRLRVRWVRENNVVRSRRGEAIQERKYIRLLHRSLQSRLDKIPPDRLHRLRIFFHETLRKHSPGSSASMPSPPVPAKRSSTLGADDLFAQAQKKIAAFTRSIVGRKSVRGVMQGNCLR